MATKRSFSILAAMSLIVGPTTSFTPLRPSSPFAGRASTVCSRAELTTELSCPPSRSPVGTRRGAAGSSGMSMPPFLKKLGLRKPGSKKEDDAEEAAAAEELRSLSSTSSYLSSLPTGAKVDVVEEETCIVPGEEKELTPLEKVKAAGKAGVVSYALWELAFWLISIPVCVFGYVQVTGHWPDFSNAEDMEKLGAEAFAFVNFARFAVPLRIGLALSTTPWIQENVIDRFFPEKQELPYCDETTET